MTVKDMQSRDDVPVMIADERGLVTFVNKKFEEVFGWTLAESMGRPITIVIPPDLHDAHNMGFSRFLASGKPRILNQKLTLQSINKAGEVFEAEHFIIAEKTCKDRWLIAASMVPLNR